MAKPPELDEDLPDLPDLEEEPNDPLESAPRRSSETRSDSSSESPGRSPRRSSRRRKPAPKRTGPVTRSHEWWLHEFNEMAAKGSYSLGEAAEAVLPTTSSVLQIRSVVVGDAVEEAARRDSRIFSVAKAVYDSQIYVLFITTLGAILLGVAIDLGRMPVYALDIDEGHVSGVNPFTRFALPKESLGVAIGVQRRYAQQRAATASTQQAQPVEPPGWYSNGAGGVVAGTSEVAG